MSGGLYITKTEWNQLVKKITYLEEYVKNSMKEKRKSQWVKPAEAMELIGCKVLKLKKLRLNGSLDFRYFGKNRGVMILRSSIEKYNKSHSTLVL